MSKRTLKKFNKFIFIFGVILGASLFVFARYYIQGDFIDSVGLSIGGFILPVINFVAQL